MAISALFDWVRIINQLVEGQQRITAADLEKLREIVRRYVFDILGLRDEKAASAGGKDLVTPLVNMLLDLRQAARPRRIGRCRIRSGTSLRPSVSGSRTARTAATGRSNSVSSF